MSSYEGENGHKLSFFAYAGIYEKPTELQQCSAKLKYNYKVKQVNKQQNQTDFNKVKSRFQK